MLTSVFFANAIIRQNKYLTKYIKNKYWGLSVALESAGPNLRHDSSTENACRSHTFLIEGNAFKSIGDFIERIFNSTDCKGSKGVICWALSTNATFQEGREGGRLRKISLPGSPKKPDDQIMLPHWPPLYGVMVSGNGSNINLKGGGGQPTLQHLLQKGKHGSDRTSPEVLILRGTPFDEQVPLQSIGPSCGLCSFWSDSECYLLG